jgi:hypothetical protein
MFDIDKLTKQMGLKKNTVNVDGTKLEMRDRVRWINISHFGTYQYRQSFSEDELWKEVRMCNNSVITPPVIELLPVTKVLIAGLKLNDIKKQLKFIPAFYHGLYSTLIAKADNTRRSDMQTDPASETLMPTEDVAEDVSICEVALLY